MTERQFDQSQLSAIESAITCGFRIITGGAGTGKTTIIESIASKLKAKRQDVVLCAFAGKAAARLREATGFDATTIHRMLGYMGDLGFTRPPMPDTTVIMDEASMVSSDLLFEIVFRTPKRLILVGDHAQLPPVGCGQPFHDLIRLRPGDVSTLTTCYRNTEAVFKAATAIRAGDMPLGSDVTPGEKWQIIGVGGPDATHAWVLDRVKAGDVDFSQDVILACRNGENENQKAAVESLNRDIAAIVNPRADGEKLKVGDRVINTKNFADIDCWNGTTGSIQAIDVDRQIWIKLDVPVLDFNASLETGESVYKDTVLFTRDRVKHLQLAYALTVHKSQGSQYRKVFFLCLCRDQAVLLDRNMIYTAVTRARQECTVVGEIRALQDGIRTEKTKNTVLQELARAGGVS
jgi:exodeoxyribonuclease V alpha subunit